ncbi:hypothetical protein ACLM5J_03670 [Nocardioides sp. Bht2]|uniref:hypothetical protein n=1 Tax=Nocardioides sp. Bht2 TaxID=3392297 RepID=UPI0039B69CBA
MFEFYPKTQGGQQTVIRVPEDVDYVGVGDDGTTLPLQFEVVFLSEREGEAAHRASFAVIGGRPVCMGAGAFMVEPDDREVQTADLRAIRVRDMLDHGVRYLAAKRSVSQAGSAWEIGPDLGREGVRKVQQARRRVNDDQLREVARVYKANLDGAPTAAVRDHFDTSLRTASNWVKRATERGFITTRQRKGE